MTYSGLAQERVINYLALGDSYTIGEAVDSADRWPHLLAKELMNKGIAVPEPKIIATTGWTTDELMNAINLDSSLLDTYDLVSLLIGVNNQYRSYPIEQYEREFEQLLKKAIQFAGDDIKKVFVLSIPDYGITPFAIEKNLDAKKIADELDHYNEIARSICRQYEVKYFNITDISRKAQDDQRYLAHDLLHPSGKMYAEWVDFISDEILQIIGDGHDE